VDQILDFRKIDNDAMPAKLTEGDIIDFIMQTFSGFFDYAEQRNIHLSLCSGIQTLHMDFDRQKMDKIITNLLMNALNYTQERGRVSVNLDFTEHALNENEIRLLIEISDTGRGISKHEVGKIFERYYTSDSTSDSMVGTGIGLHLTKSLVELHGGEIKVTSKPDKGTIFTVMFPAKKDKLIIAENMIRLQNSISEKTIKNKSPDTKIVLHKKTIVVIDDNIDMCMFIENILAGEFNIIKEVDPQNGVGLILRHMPDLIISDVMMPGINGFELCENIKSDIRISHIPVILLTAKATVEDHITGFDTGADDYIYKPFDSKLLISRVRNLIRQKELLRDHFIGIDGKINKSVTVSSLDRSFMDNVLSIILEKHHIPDFTVNTIIREIGMSRSVFYKKFRALSKISINDVIKQFRLRKACELMKTDSLTIGEIAYQSGFSDPSYFTRVFRETYDLTPREYISKRSEKADEKG
ncbi:MAG: ATP-binding protein, partial [Bacteroidales bacterium]|jgi:CheY-like chemotaxis protein